MVFISQRVKRRAPPGDGEREEEVGSSLQEGDEHLPRDPSAPLQSGAELCAVSQHKAAAAAPSDFCPSDCLASLCRFISSKGGSKKSLKEEAGIWGSGSCPENSPSAVEIACR